MLEKIGIGIDIVEISRFSKMPFTKNEKFYKKIFHQSELEHCLNKKNSSESFAAQFAIKESVIKSIDKKIDFLDIQINYSNAKPMVHLTNDSSYRFLVSTSHEENNAVAVVISEKIH